jgi:two-component system cell cycle response regulator DivK
METARKILYIEDNFDNRLLVRRLLQASGYDFLEAENAFQALDILAENNPNMILMDINMPDMDGYALTQKIKGMPQYKDVPVIAITANVMRGDKERTLQAGCDGYIEKPIDVDQFLDQIDRFFEG